MKKLFVILIWSTTLATGFSQSLSLKFGTPFRRADLNIRWTVPTNALPSPVWIYHLLPNGFSPEAISNLMVMCAFTEKELTRRDTNWIVFENSNKSRRLGILVPLGSIEYEVRENHTPTNLVHGVPTETEALTLTTNVLQKLGVSVSDIERKEGSQEPNFHLFGDQIYFFAEGRIITNLMYRGVRFSRAVDGARFIGGGTGGNGEIRFGDHGKVSYISLSWRNLKRQSAYPTASPQKLIKWMQEGKAVQGMIAMDAEPIDWKTVKNVTVTGAKLCYYAGTRFEPSDWLMPFVALWTTVDRGHGTIDVEIDCPIIAVEKAQ